MKKRIIGAIGTVLTILICSISLIACAPSKPDKFLAEFAFAKKWTVDVMEVPEGIPPIAEDVEIEASVSTTVYDGKNYAFVIKKGDKLLLQEYLMLEDNVPVLYTKDGEKEWMRTLDTVGSMINDMKKLPTGIVMGIAGIGDKDAFNHEILAERLSNVFELRDKKWYIVNNTVFQDNYFLLRANTMTQYYPQVIIKKDGNVTEYRPQIVFKLDGRVVLPGDARKLK